jgi:DNA polymerase-3 subunit alpha
MQNRPYDNVFDFVHKVPKKVVACNKVINLIKAGAFNKLEKKTTEQILREYIETLSEPKTKLTLQNAQMLIEHDLIPADKFAECIATFKLTKLLRTYRDDNKLYYILMPDVDRTLIYQNNMNIMSMDVNHNGRILEVIDSNKWDAVYENKMSMLRSYIKTNEKDLLVKLNQALFQEQWDKYAKGDQLQWELDALKFYYSGNPLQNVAAQLPVPTTLLSDVQEGLTDGFFSIKGKQIPRMHLYSIIGTVLDKNTTKGIVTIQTTDGVIGLKIYKDLFAFYNHDFETKVGDQTFYEPSFFEIGTHLLVTGIKRGETFVPKVYKNSGMKPIMRIVLDDKNNYVCLKEKKTEATTDLC